MLCIQKGAISPYVFAYCCIRYITRTKLLLCIQKGSISPMSLHIAASDISQGQNWCCVFKKMKYRLCLCILLHLIYNILGHNCCCVFKKLQYRPMSLHFAASAVSQGHSWCCVFKMVQYNDNAYNNNNNNNNNNKVNMTRMSV